MTKILEFSDEAVVKLKEIFAEQNATDSYLRVVAKETPQGGVSYDFGLVGAPEDDDEQILGEIKALVDKQSAALLRGSKVDYVETFEKTGFLVNNPNFQGCPCGGSCGCK